MREACKNTWPSPPSSSALQDADHAMILANYDVAVAQAFLREIGAEIAARYLDSLKESVV